MAQTQTTKRKTAGRPAKGPNGERVSDYPRLTIRLPRVTKNQLEALSTLRRVPVWELVDQAVKAYIEQLPNDERKPLTQFSRRMGGE
jgi:hypothetical protein